MSAELDSQKLIIAAHVRQHDSTSYIYDDNSSSTSKLIKRPSKDDPNASQTSINSKKTMNNSRMMSQQNVSQRSIKTTMTGQTTASGKQVGASSKPKTDSKVNLYACRPIDKTSQPQIVNVSSTPLSYSLLSKHFPGDVNFASDQKGILPTSKQFKFDVAFSQETSQERLYATLLQKRMKQVLNGFQLSTILIGESETGRKYVLRGDENIMNKNGHAERGLVLRSCEDLLSMMNISKESIRSRKAIPGGVYYHLGVQIYCVRDDVEVDLLVNAPEQLLNRESDEEIEMGCFDITDVNDLLTYYRQAYNRLTMIHDTLVGTDFMKQSSVFIRLLVLKNKQVYSSVNFISLFDFDETQEHRVTPILEYLSEVEKLHNRQMKAYAFQNKVLQHLNKCFSSGPEYTAVLLGVFDSNPQSVSVSEILLKQLASIRESEVVNAGKSLRVRLSTKEVRDFVLNSHRKSQASEQNETAGFIDSYQDQEWEQDDPERQGFFGQNNAHNEQDIAASLIGGGSKSEIKRVASVMSNGSSIGATGDGAAAAAAAGQQASAQNVSRRLTQQTTTSEILIEDANLVGGRNGLVTLGGNGEGENALVNNGDGDLSFNSSDLHNTHNNMNSHQQLEDSGVVLSRGGKDFRQLIDNVFNFTDSTKGMNAEEVARWIRCQERNLELLEGSLGSGSAGEADKQEIRKLSQAKAFLASLKASQQGQQGQGYEEQSSSVENHRKVNSEMKSKIMEQIDRTIEQNMRGSQASRFSQGSLVSHQSSSSKRITTLESQNVDDTSDRIMRIVNDEFVASGKESRKSNRRRDRNAGSEENELRNEMTQLQEDVTAMQIQIKERDRLIDRLEVQLQEEVRQKQSSQQAEVYSRQFGESQKLEKMQRLQEKYALKKQLIEELKEEIIIREKRHIEERRVQEQTIDDLQAELDKQRLRLQAEIVARQNVENVLEQAEEETRNKQYQIDRIAVTLREKEKGLRELQGQIYSEEDSAKEARAQNQMLERKVADLVSQLNRYEDELSDSRNTLERDRRRIEEEHADEIARLKEKNRVLKQDLKLNQKQYIRTSVSGGGINSSSNNNSRSFAWGTSVDEATSRSVNNKPRLY